MQSTLVAWGAKAGDLPELLHVPRPESPYTAAPSDTADEDLTLDDWTRFLEG